MQGVDLVEVESERQIRNNDANISCNSTELWILYSYIIFGKEGVI